MKSLIREHKANYIERMEGFRRPTIRDYVRARALDCLTMFQRWPIKNASWNTPRVQFLLLHHVFEDEIAQFNSLLQQLQKKFRFISYTEAWRRILKNEIDQPYLTFSFDDGSMSCKNAAAELAKFNGKACFFVCPDFVEATSFNNIKNFSKKRLNHGPVRFMNWDDLMDLIDQGHEIGGHTVSHPDLSKISENRVEDEVAKSFEILAAAIGQPKHFAWPYGRFTNITQFGIEAVFKAGYRSIASGERGAHGLSKNDDLNHFENHVCLHRDSIVASWPQKHVFYFLERAASNPILIKNSWD